MRLNVYTIYDQAAGAYLRPFFMQSDGQAMRTFTDIATDADHDIGRHPKDYSLFRIGSWDDNTAKLIPDEKECLATALEVIALSRKIEPAQLDAFDKEVTELSPGGTA